MPEVKKPRSLRMRKDWTLRAFAWRYAESDPTAPYVHMGSGFTLRMNAQEARRFACWLEDYYAPWAKSFEPEFDERNE